MCWRQIIFDHESNRYHSGSNQQKTPPINTQIILLSIEEKWVKYNGRNPEELHITGQIPCGSNASLLGMNKVVEIQNICPPVILTSFAEALHNHPIGATSNVR